MYRHGVVGRGRVGGVPEDARDALLVAALRFRCAWHVPGEHDVGSLVAASGLPAATFAAVDALEPSASALPEPPCRCP